MSSTSLLSRGLGIALVALACGSAHAQVPDNDYEREQLARIAAEIAQVQALVAKASHSAAPGQRVNFRYDWLQRDLEMVREGIRQHVEAPRQPRPVPPLRGDYRE